MTAWSLKETIWKFGSNTQTFFPWVQNLAFGHIMQNICSVAYFIFHEVFLTLCFQPFVSIHSLPCPHEPNPFSFRHGHYHFKGEKKQTTVPPSQPLFFWPALPSLVVGGHNTWAPHTKCQLTKSPGHRRKCRSSKCIIKLKPLVVKTPQTKEQAEKVKGRTRLHSDISFQRCRHVHLVFRRSPFFSMFIVLRICVSHIYTYL